MKYSKAPEASQARTWALVKHKKHVFIQMSPGGGDPIVHLDSICYIAKALDTLLQTWRVEAHVGELAEVVSCPEHYHEESSYPIPICILYYFLDRS